jgi:hypothetical protein
MKQINVGQLISILANVGVIAGIVFLALELQQNNSFLQSDAEYRVMQNRMLFNTELLDDADLLAAYRKAEAGENLSEIERQRLSLLYRRTYSSFGWEFAQAERGLTTQFPVDRFRWFITTNDVARDTWLDMQDDFAELDPEFYEFLSTNGFILQ